MYNIQNIPLNLFDQSKSSRYVYCDRVLPCLRESDRSIISELCAKINEGETDEALHLFAATRNVDLFGLCQQWGQKAEELMIIGAREGFDEMI